MADQQHRATDGEWASVKARAPGGVAYSTILELLHRIEALEAKDEDDNDAWAARLRRPGRSQAERIASLAERITSLQKRIDALEAAQPAKPNHPEIPDSSLVERVAAAIHPSVCADPNLYLHEARAAIRAVADWLLKNYGGQTATTDLLEQEAER